MSDVLLEHSYLKGQVDLLEKLRLLGVVNYSQPEKLYFMLDKDGFFHVLLKVDRGDFGYGVAK